MLYTHPSHCSSADCRVYSFQDIAFFELAESCCSCSAISKATVLNIPARIMDHVPREYLESIEREQDALRGALHEDNVHFWQRECVIASSPQHGSEATDPPGLRFVGGLDLSCPKDDSSVACGALVVLQLPEMKVVYQDTIVDKLTIPYIPGFLGAREYPMMGKLLERLRERSVGVFPQVLLTDGNGILHPRGCGSACYVGVREQIPTIGVAKTLYRMPSWGESYEREIHAQLRNYQDELDLSHDGKLVGKAVIASRTSCKPVYVSVGHSISLDTAVWVVQQCTKYRIPEPVRQADILSRQLVAKFPLRANP